MSYTMTIEAPEKVAWFEQRRQDYSEEQLGDLFIAFLMKRDGEKQDREKTASVSARVHALRGVIRLPENFDERAFKAERLSNRLEV